MNSHFMKNIKIEYMTNSCIFSQYYTNLNDKYNFIKIIYNFFMIKKCIFVDFLKISKIFKKS